MSEKQNNRKKNIISLLQQKEKATISEIAGILNVSNMTVRRDLTEMEKEGFIRRTHGGAILSSGTITIEDPYTINKETTRNIRQKSVIGEKAASLINPNEIIFFDSGSTTYFVAKFVDKKMPFTAVCYTFKNAIEFYKWRDVNLVLMGGFLHRESNIFHSINGISQISNIRVDKAFISAAGVDEDLGLTTYFYFEADIKKAMIAAAKQRILVVDSSKFGKVSITFFASLGDIDMIITDDGISEEYKEIINSKGIELCIA
jgi:DeoR family transcriptional regulator, deoxyribose operon repressor